MGLKVGDYIVCIDNIGEIASKILIVGKVYKIEKTLKNDIIIGDDYFYYKRFRKAIKRKSNPIIKKLCKNYIEKDGYIYI